MKHFFNYCFASLLIVLFNAFSLFCYGQAVVNDHNSKDYERILIELPYPTFNSKDSGIVVIDVIIEKSGSIIKAAPDMKETHVTNKKLIDNSLKSAYKAKFNAINKDTIESKKITYRFSLK